ncbi:MAG: hypothetical protein ABSH41_20615 [Syntrophobacteraceae bacterium]
MFRKMGMHVCIDLLVEPIRSLWAPGDKGSLEMLTIPEEGDLFNGGAAGWVELRNPTFGFKTQDIFQASLWHSGHDQVTEEY